MIFIIGFKILLSACLFNLSVLRRKDCLQNLKLIVEKFFHSTQFAWNQIGSRRSWYLKMCNYHPLSL